MSSNLFTTYNIKHNDCFMMYDFNCQINLFLFIFIINPELNVDQLMDLEYI